MSLERRSFLKALAIGAALPYRSVANAFSSSATTPPRASAAATSLRGREPETDIDRLYDNSVVIDSLAVGHEWDEVEYEAVKRSGYTGIQTTLPSDSFERAARALAERAVHPDLNPDPQLPADTRLWAALQAVGGGTWGGCVYDVERIVERLNTGNSRGP